MPLERKRLRRESRRLWHAPQLMHLEKARGTCKSIRPLGQRPKACARCTKLMGSAAAANQGTACAPAWRRSCQLCGTAAICRPHCFVLQLRDVPGGPWGRLQLVTRGCAGRCPRPPAADLLRNCFPAASKGQPRCGAGLSVRRAAVGYRPEVPHAVGSLTTRLHASRINIWLALRLTRASPAPSASHRRPRRLLPSWRRQRQLPPNHPHCSPPPNVQTKAP